MAESEEAAVTATKEQEEEEEEMSWEQRMEAESTASVRGTNPQNLVEKILRNRIFDSLYWKESCFGLTAATLVDKAVELTEVGGTSGSMRRPTPFLALTLRMLQIQPERDIVIELIQNEEFRYVRLLGAFYLRLTGQSLDVYRFIEPLFNDLRRIAVVSPEGKHISHVDEFAWSLLHDNFVCDISLPHIPKRCMLENLGLLERRVSALPKPIPAVQIPAPAPALAPAPAPALAPAPAPAPIPEQQEGHHRHHSSAEDHHHSHHHNHHERYRR